MERDEDLLTILNALADPVRLDICYRLQMRGNLTCGGLGLQVSPATVSHHLKVLRNAGIIETQAEGNTRRSRLQIEALEERFPGLLGAVLSAYRKKPVRVSTGRGVH